MTFEYEWIEWVYITSGAVILFWKNLLRFRNSRQFFWFNVVAKQDVKFFEFFFLRFSFLYFSRNYWVNKIHLGSTYTLILTLTAFSMIFLRVLAQLRFQFFRRLRTIIFIESSHENFEFLYPIATNITFKNVANGSHPKPKSNVWNLYTQQLHFGSIGVYGVKITAVSGWYLKWYMKVKQRI